MTTPQTIVFFHASCNDGFACAYLYWKLNPSATFFPVQAGKPIGDYHLKNINKETVVYFFDLTPSNIIVIKNLCKSIMIIDHHITSKTLLESLSPNEYIFDNNHSASYLTSNYFYPNDEPSLLIKYIEDRDIWTNKMPYTEEVSSWLFTLDWKFEIYKNIDNEESILKGIEIGKSILKYSNTLVDDSCKNATICLQEINGITYLIGYINSPILRSDIGSAMLKMYPLLDFSIVYYIDERRNSTNFSLRSTDDRVDVSIIAKYFNGGGHRNSSGCDYIGVITNRLMGKIFNDKVYNIISSVNNISNEEYNYIYYNSDDLNLMYTLINYLSKKPLYNKTILVSYSLKENITYFNIINKELNEKMKTTHSYKGNTIYKEGAHKILF